MKTNKQTNKQTNEIRRKIVFFFISFSLCFMQSCSTEDVAIEQQSTIETVSKNEAISFVKNFNDSKKTTAKISGLQSEFIFDKVTQEKLTNTSELLTVIPIKTKAQNQRRRALFLRVGTQIESMIYHEFAQSLFTNETFSGIVLMTRLNGDFIRAYRLKNNEYVIDLVPSKKLESSQKTTMRSGESGDPIELNEVVVYSRFKIFNGFVSLTNLGNEVPISITWDPNYNGGGGSGGGAFSIVVVEKDFEDKIDDSALDPCSKAVLDKLKLSTENDISKMINRFNPATSVFNIKMSTGKVRNTVNWAETTKAASSAADVNMVFNEDYIKGTLFGTRPTDLSVATTMAHEIIHAYLISLLEDHLKNSSVGINDFPTIFDAYVQQQASKNPSILPDAHHELIADKYVNAIASTIEQFHLGDTFHSGYSRQVYLDMA